MGIFFFPPRTDLLVCVFFLSNTSTLRFQGISVTKCLVLLFLCRIQLLLSVVDFLSVGHRDIQNAGLGGWGHGEATAECGSDRVLVPWPGADEFFSE